jgi:hypothetical protein
VGVEFLHRSIRLHRELQPPGLAYPVVSAFDLLSLLGSILDHFIG